MAKYSHKIMGKEVGQAEVYAPPHAMTGKDVDATNVTKKPVDPNTLAAKDVTCKTQGMRVSAGDPGSDYVKTDGIKIRGTGAATKGTMARGPLG